MHYLIDGYNLLFHILKKRGSLEKNRQLLIKELNEIASQLHLRITVVFDGSHEHLPHAARSHFDALEIIYTSQSQTADEYIFHEVCAASRPQYLTIVTNDRELKNKCTQMYAQVISIDQFLSKLLSKKRKKKKKEIDTTRAFSDSQHELNRLLALFEKKLREDLSNE